MPALFKAKPFLKWAGGKTRLLETLSNLLPETIDTYYEPFIGGGALFFHLAHEQRFRHAILNDFNPELVNCYQVVRDAVEALIAQLKTFQVTRDEFYAVRALDPLALSTVHRAARTIYLNRTCFNGLYRLNKRGAFNVPRGDYKDPRVVDEGNLHACSALLHSVTLREGGFVQAVKGVVSGDAVYFDPPYVPLNATSNFKSYTKEGFTLDDQQRLAECFRELADRGVFVLESNSDTATVHNLYKGFERRVVRMRRNINSKADSRGAVNELVVMVRPGGGEEWDHRGYQS
jgi:DNA adenine methylase